MSRLLIIKAPNQKSSLPGNLNNIYILKDLLHIYRLLIIPNGLLKRVSEGILLTALEISDGLKHTGIVMIVEQLDLEISGSKITSQTLTLFCTFLS